MQLHRSPKPLQKGVVAQLVASKGPWVITRSEGDDTEIRVHSYSGDLLATVDTKQVQNLQLSVSPDGCFFGCAAWAPGVKIFEVKAKGGAFQKTHFAATAAAAAARVAAAAAIVAIAGAFAAAGATAAASDTAAAAARVATGTAAAAARVAAAAASGTAVAAAAAVRACFAFVALVELAGEDTKLVCESANPIKTSGSTSLHFTLDGSLLIVVSGPNLFFFHTATLELFKAMEHATPQPIQHLLVAPNNKFLLLCAEGSRPVIWRLPLPQA
ncbi:hypothetical protein Emed_004067 [Eimeria media]